MTTYVEIHALHTVPPSCINRDDTGAPKTAPYGGVIRSRVSSQAWKRAIRDQFNNELDPKEVGTRSTQITSEIATSIRTLRPDLAGDAIDLAVAAMEAAGFKKPVAKTRGRDKVLGDPETGYLVFLSQHQIDALAQAAVDTCDEPDPKKSMKAAKVKELANADHSIDIALFGRMIADSADLNVDAACQVAHALSVHEAEPQYDFYTAVDDARARDEDEIDAGAGMMGTVGYVAATLYRYAAVNVDQLERNLGSADAPRRAIQVFLRAFVESMPTGKINTFANHTRPSAVLVTIATGQPTSLVGAFEEPVRADGGYLKPAVARLADYADEYFSTWRQPSHAYVLGLPTDVEPLSRLGDRISLDELATVVPNAATEQA